MSGTIPSNDACELTAGQLVLWAGQCLQPSDPLYNMAIVFRLAGRLDADAFARGFDTLVARTDSLRARVTGEDDAPMQVFQATAAATLERVDLAASPSPEAALRAWLAARCVRPLDPRLCSWDSALLRLADDDHAWYLNQHHLYTDAWTKAVLFRRMGECYTAALAGDAAPLTVPPQFRDHVERDRLQRDSPRLAKARRYWQARLSTPPSPSRFYRPTPRLRSGRTVRVTLDLGAERSSRLRALAASPRHRALTADLALFNLFATVLVALLHRLGGQDELVIGTPSLNRGSPAARETAGLFIELFPLCVGVAGDDSFATLAARVARESQALLINAVPGACGPEQSRAYDVVLNFITARFGSLAGLPARSEWIHPGHGDRNHLLRLQVQDFDARGVFSLAFDLGEECFPRAERERVLEHFTRVLDACLDDPDRRVADVALLDEAQQAAQLAALRGPRRPVPPHTVVDLFEAQAAHTPDAVALAAGASSCGTDGGEVGYAELRRTSLCIAAALAARGIGAGGVVAIALPRGMPAVRAILGVLRSGAAYLPLDPRHPRERLAYVLADARAELVITSACRQAELDGVGPPTVVIDELSRAAPENTPPPPAPGDLAYILYTSGSTGRPKGVAVAHASLANYIGWAARRYCEGEPRGFPLFTPLTFDLTVTSLLTPLTVGGTLVVYEEADAGRDLTVRRVVVDERVQVVKLTPAHLALVQDLDLTRSRLRAVVVGGEDFKTALAQSVHRRLGGRAAVYNEYGPTEATVACMIHRYDPARDTGGSVPIGRAIDNLEIYLLGADGRPVPQGAPGEIAIGGAGVARGYLADLRAPSAGDEAGRVSRFVDNPFRPGERLYRSGDRGYLDADGVVHYLGRADTQVKVRGVRVEAAEVEAALLAHPDVDECVVGTVGAASTAVGAFCRECGLDARHPDAALDADGVCRLCRDFHDASSPARRYFGSSDALRPVVERIRAAAGAPPHCLMLLSGGKDSTYALCRIVEMGLRPLVFTLDNGYISEGAKTNIRRVVDKLGLELVVGSTPAMNDIFRDSLARFSNVCNGCFKTIYTLATKLAHERGIRHVVTGLSRGQIFETRLADLYQHGVTDPADVDRTIVEARKAYHRIDDAVSRCLDVSLFEDDAVFDEIEFVDFYRYCDASLEEMLDYLATQAPWIRPADTGRSTNCLINDVGIHVHKLERGYHNYALPYSWDVRLGHKQRDAARHELDDRIDRERVERILGEVGYQPVPGAYGNPVEDRLVAWFVARQPPAPEDLRLWLAAKLPPEFLPSAFVAVDALPLTANGKVDRAALPRPERSDHGVASAYMAPEGGVEESLAAIWAEVLGLPQVGAHDNFFDLGGDSILSLQIVSRARAAGLVVSPQQVFDHPTVAGLAAAAGADAGVQAEQGEVRDRAPPTPAQQAFLEQHDGDLDRHAQVALLELAGDAEPATVRDALLAVWRHHDALRSRFERDADGRWQQWFGEVDEPPVLAQAESPWPAAPDLLHERGGALARELDVARGRLMAGTLLCERGRCRALLLAVHPLVVDALSWWVMLEDSDRLLLDAKAGRAPRLPAKTTSVAQWSQALARHAVSDGVLQQADYWRAAAAGADLAFDDADQRPRFDGERGELSFTLDPTRTRRLLQEAATALRAQVPDLLAAALVEAVHARTGRDRLTVTVESHGRESVAPGLDLLRTVGALASACPVRLARPAAGGRPALLRAVKEQLRGLPGRGAGYGLLRYTDAAPDIARELAGLPAPSLLLSYMGQWDRPGGASAAVRFREPLRRVGAAARDSAALEIEAVVFDGRLQVRFGFRPDACRAETAEALADAFREALAALVEDAATSAPAALSPSDFPQADLRQDELDDILAEFGDDA